MQRIQFHLGEERYVRLRVHATNGEPFVIRQANWKLCWAGQLEAEGECIIDGALVSAKIVPMRRTIYRLSVRYAVAGEKLIEEIEVVVT